MSTIGSIGIGLFVLIIVWLLTLVLFVFAVRLQSNLGWLGLGVASILTLILVLIPTDSPKSTEEFVLYDYESKDYSIIYKKLLLSFLVVSAILSAIICFMTYCIEPIRPKPINTFCCRRPSVAKLN